MVDMTGKRTIDARPYPWPHGGSLDFIKTALVVIDMQRDFCEEGGYLALQGYDIEPVRRLIPKVSELLESFRAASYPVFFTREGHRSDLASLSAREQFRSRNNKLGIGIGDEGPLGRVLIRGEKGHDIVPELYPLEFESVIDKPGKGAFANTDFDLLLRIEGIRNLVFCGVTTDVCVHTTMREANDRGYDCLLVEDCCQAAEQDLHDAAVKSVTMEGGIFGAVAKSADVMATLRTPAADKQTSQGGTL